MNFLHSWGWRDGPVINCLLCNHEDLVGVSELIMTMMIMMMLGISVCLSFHHREWGDRNNPEAFPPVIQPIGEFTPVQDPV